MKSELNNGTLTIWLDGRIDSHRAPTVEIEINNIVKKTDFDHLVLDAEDMEYISSAGLRIILKLLKKHRDVTLVNVSSEVYEILEMTGFTEMMTVERALKCIDVTGKKIIGKGANGVIYRIDNDTIVKVYNEADTLDHIKAEHDMSRTAFILGIPTAIPFGIVKVGERYGSIFELINARTFAELLQQDPTQIEFVAQQTVELAKTLHETEAPVGIPLHSDVARQWLDEAKSSFDPQHFAKLSALIKMIPETGTMLHGDLHIKNIMQYEDEALLIDMDTLSAGHPIYELACIYNAYEGFGICDPNVFKNFLSVDESVVKPLLHRILELYLETDDEDRINEVKEKASVIGLLRVLRRIIRIGEQDTPEGKKLLEECRDRINRAVDHLDTLTF
ncbi:anti-sigma factor antagonist [Ruminococcus difficilis]|uniref:Anti-sigma factor antagonist n=1 Tax=Ruminococcus difficilis TaxID=2763069 RepID=A0A934TYE3_9FIRM|nr:anti-sigma factor antagonist [Ruminococcus difficilis]MBK6087480.1 anti-sigma factor antagonist [Ruminococcus difficilis]